jgi:hypothetical protein
MDMKSLLFNPETQAEEIQAVAFQISDFLDEHGIEHDMHSVWTEKEWTDFRIFIGDRAQMKRIDTWLQEDIKQVIKGYEDIEISAPNPLKGKEHELRIRIYELDKKV